MIHKLLSRLRLQCAVLVIGLQLLLSANLTARELSPEKFLMHTDKKVYLSGETIFYKISNINYGQLSDHSRIAYVNFHDKTGKLRMQQKVSLKDGYASGSIILPLTLEEDYYYLTCFTKWNLQFEKYPVEARRLAVFNPYESTPNTAVQNVAADSASTQGPSHNIVIELQDQSYRSRENCAIRFSLPEGTKANVSVSVHAQNNAVSKGFDLFPAPGQPVYYEKISGIISKEQGLRIEGSAADPQTGKPLISDVLSLYKAGGDKFYRVPEQSGFVSPEVADFIGEARFQIFNMNPYQTQIPAFTLKRAGEHLMGLPQDQPPPVRNEAAERYIMNARLSSKIQEIFEVMTADSLAGSLKKDFPFKADKVYLMQKYKSMNTLEEFLREIVSYAEVSESNGNATVRLKNRQTKLFFMEQPWYLVDGYLTRDEEAVLNIPFKNLMRVELYYTDKTILGQLETMMIRSGMIAVYTDNFCLNEQIESGINNFSFRGLSIPLTFATITPTGKDAARENPVFDELVYWNPELKIEGSASVTFVPSDIIGDYVVELLGTDENGRILTGSKTFSVIY